MLSTITSATMSTFLINTLCALLFGAAIAWNYTYRHIYNKNFVITLAIIPITVQMVIMLVNGNLGTGIAVAGAFSLVRFRSVPGSAKDITSIFYAMAAGLAAGTGSLVFGALFVAIVIGINLLYSSLKIWEPKSTVKSVQITLPEGTDYTQVFEDIFDEYTKKHELLVAKTVDLGSLYKLTYNVELKDANKQKAFLDAVRTRNGNLEVACSRPRTNAEEL